MTERKYTDEEVIKALECCSKPYCNNNDCPLHEHTINTKDCITKLSTNALDLINRQKAEIEELEAEIDKQYEQARADILGNMADGGTSCHWCIEQHQAKAIKEFAKRLKCHSYQSVGDNGYISPCREVSVEDIDNIVAEMTEGENG